MTTSIRGELTYLVTLNILSSLRALRTESPKEPAFGLKWVQITSNTLPLITMQSNLKVKVKAKAKIKSENIKHTPIIQSKVKVSMFFPFHFFCLFDTNMIFLVNTCWMTTQSRPCGPWPTFAQLSRRWKRQGRYTQQYLKISRWKFLQVNFVCRWKNWQMFFCPFGS